MKKFAAVTSQFYLMSQRFLNSSKQNSKIQIFLYVIILSILSIGCSNAQAKAPAPYGPVPNENQLRWQEMEFYAFIHFSLNTYTDQSWGYGNEDVNLFNPTELDCRRRIYRRSESIHFVLF